MDYTKLERYEYKAPSYALIDRPDHTDYQKHTASRRYVYDPQIGGYRSTAPVEDSVSLLFAGDLLCQENMLEQYATKDGFDFSLCFQYLKPLFASADFVGGNLETPISHTAPYRGDILTHEGPYFCNAPIQYLEALSDAGFDMLTTENNHTLDAGVRGLAETIENVRKMGMMQTGTFLHNQDKFLVVDICGFKVGFTAFGSGAYNTMQENVTRDGRKLLLNTYSPERAKSIYAGMKKQGAQYMVCFPHWGKEYTKEIHNSQLTIADELTKMGYDLVLGSHSHVLQMFRLVNKKPVVYSLGNLISHLNVPYKTGSHYTVLCHLKLTRDKKNIHSDVEFIPCRIVKNYHGIPFTVLPVNEALGLTEAEEPALKSLVKETVSRLRIKPTRILPNFPVEEDAFRAYRKAVSETDSSLARLQPIPYEQPEPLPIRIPKKRFWEKFDGYYESKNRLYKLFSSHAELVQNNGTSRVIKLPDKVEGQPVTVIRKGSKGNTTAKLIYLGAYVTHIENRAFYNYTGLESVRLLNRIECIGKKSFANCTNMTGVVLPKSLTTIQKKAFAGCSNLRSVRIPASVTYIAPDAFRGCPDLVIYCTKESFAEAYAKKNRISFRYLSAKKSNTPRLPKAADIVNATDLSEFVHPFWKDPAHNRMLPIGTMNGPGDSHPATIIASCYYLGHPLPRDAKCAHQPSYYIGTDAFDGTLDAITQALGDRLPRIAPATLKKYFSVFNEKYKNVVKPTFNFTDQAVYFTDWLLFARVQGFHRDEYFDFELYNKEPDIRATFLDDAYRLHIWQMCADVAYRDHFRVKSKFNAKYKKYVSRDSCNVKLAGYEKFCEFLKKHPTFFAKPLARTGGKGARFLSTDTNTPEELYEICCDEILLAEEVIQQHADIAAFNPGTLNTIRVVTLITAENKPTIIWALVRFGRVGGSADNFHAGGVCATLNPHTGVIVSDAIDQYHNPVTHHPDSGLQFYGFQYPHWEAVKKFVLQAALEIPEVRHVGWDVAITEDGTPKLVEGNTRSGFAGLQTTTQTGFKHLYEQYIQDLAELTNTPYTPAPLPDLDLSSMQTD